MDDIQGGEVRSSGAPLLGLPPRDQRRLIGREKDLEDAKSRLSQCRVLTLTGVGGVGKTRFAQELAWDRTPPIDENGAIVGNPEFRRVVWVGLYGVECQEQPDDEVVGAVASRLGIQNNGADDLLTLVIRELQKPYPVLLVFDNCEHVIDAAASLVALLHDECPNLKVLATSQHTLNLATEQVQRLEPLRPPAEGEDVAGNAAVQLLIQSAQERGLPQTFTVTPEIAPYLRALTERVDGIPWAVRHAGHRLATTSPRAILDDWRQRPDGMLIRGRGRGIKPQHLTSRASFQWMTDGLTEQEKRALRRLSHFSGSCGFRSEAAAAAIADADPDPTDPDAIHAADVEELIVSLWEKSALEMDSLDARGEHREHPRYTMLSLVRSPCRVELADHGEDEVVAKQHLAYLVGLTGQAAETWLGPKELDWLDYFREEEPNISIALNTAEQHDPVSGLMLLLNLIRVRSPIHDGRLRQTAEWIFRMLDALAEHPPDPEHAPDPEQTSALVAASTATAGWLLAIIGDEQGAKQALDRATELAAGRAIPPVLLLNASYQWIKLGWGAEAQPAFLDAREACLAMGDRGGAHMATMLLALCLTSRGATDTAASIVVEYMREAEESGAVWARSWAQTAKSMHLLDRAQETPDSASRAQYLRDAKTLIDEACQTSRDIDCRWSAAWATAVQGWVLAAQGQHRLAALMLGASQRAQDRLNANLAGMPGVAHLTAAADQACREHLGDKEYQAAFAEGRSQGHAALDSVLDAADISDSIPLTARQWEVLRLMAEGSHPEGLTYREIARRLGIAPRTVEGHAQKAMRRLGLDDKDKNKVGDKDKNKNKEAATAWARRRITANTAKGA